AAQRGDMAGVEQNGCTVVLAAMDHAMADGADAHVAERVEQSGEAAAEVVHAAVVFELAALHGLPDGVVERVLERGGAGVEDEDAGAVRLLALRLIAPDRGSGSILTAQRAHFRPCA